MYDLLGLLFSIYPEPPMCRSALRLQSDYQDYNDANLVLLQPLPVADATAGNHVTVLPPAEPLTGVSPLIHPNHAIAPSTDGSSSLEHTAVSSMRLDKEQIFNLFIAEACKDFYTTVSRRGHQQKLYQSARAMKGWRTKAPSPQCRMGSAYRSKLRQLAGILALPPLCAP